MSTTRLSFSKVRRLSGRTTTGDRIGVNYLRMEEEADEEDPESVPRVSECSAEDGFVFVADPFLMRNSYEAAATTPNLNYVPSVPRLGEDGLVLSVRRPRKSRRGPYRVIACSLFSVFVLMPVLFVATLYLEAWGPLELEPLIEQTEVIATSTLEVGARYRVYNPTPWDVHIKSLDLDLFAADGIYLGPDRWNTDATIKGKETTSWDRAIVVDRERFTDAIEALSRRTRVRVGGKISFSVLGLPLSSNVRGWTPEVQAIPTAGSVAKPDQPKPSS